MASIIKVGNKWRAQVRRKGFPARTETFETKILADKWARRIESEIDAGRAGVKPKTGRTVKELVEAYTERVEKTKPFGRNKADVLERIKVHLGRELGHSLTPERIVKYIREDRKIHGPTAAIDLTYLKGVLKLCRSLLGEPVVPGVVDDARELLKYLNVLHRSNERDRRPTGDEIAALRGYFAEHSVSLTPDIIDFILDSCFRPPSEICRLLWADLNEHDRTIVIHDRKDPRRKIGNDQIVPLLGRCMEIIKRQPRTHAEIFPVNGKSWSSLFPRACSKLNIEDLTLYDLRHEAISRLVEADKHSILEMMLITGHKDPKQLRRYTQLRARDLHR